MRDEKEKSKQGQTNKQTNKAKQHSTPKVVTFPEKNELPQVGLERTLMHISSRPFICETLPLMVHSSSRNQSPSRDVRSLSLSRAAELVHTHTNSNTHSHCEVKILYANKTDDNYIHEMPCAVCSMKSQRRERGQSAVMMKQARPGGPSSWFSVGAGCRQIQ